MTAIEQATYIFLKSKGLYRHAIAGIMGNLFAESNMRPNNLQDTFNTTLNMSDEEYTSKVDNGTYTNFIYDKAGYGIAQWTASDRKKNLYDICKANNKSISDLNCQLTLLYTELGTRNLIKKLNSSKTIKDASTIFLKEFEVPRDMGIEVQNYRASLGQKYDMQFDQIIQMGGTTMKYNSSNTPLKCIMTNSTCFRQTSGMTIKGVLWHSTGANNPNLKRYVQPSDGDANYQQLIQLLGKNTSGNDWNHMALMAGLNAWIGKLADGTITSVQTMPWNYKPWGCGTGANGSCNDGWIQFEICEDSLADKEYFDAVYKEGCELTAYLCKEYGLNPKGTVSFKNKVVPVILCHNDSAKLGLGNNHADVLHWFVKYGKTMEDVRNDVAKLLAAPAAEPVINDTKPGVANPANTQKVQKLAYTRLLKKGRDGDDVMALQKALIALGYSVGSYGADGDFGNATEQAVIRFQRDNGLDDDGEVGPLTVNAINKKLAKLGTSSTNTSQSSSTTSSSSNLNTGGTIQMYRVRKAWDQPKTQVGAFSILENAKKACDNAGSGYYVFDSKGNQVYPTNSTIVSTATSTITPSSSSTPITPTKTYSGVKIGSASKDENGKYVNGVAGDQTGKEVWILDWYDQNWTSVLRPKDAALAEKIAQQCENACNNNKIGYSQSTRNTILAQAKTVNYNLSKITTPCNCDCSSFVSACCVCAGLPEATFFPGGNGCVTSTIGPACIATGKFTELTDIKYRNQNSYLKRGDILLNKNQHVVIVLSNGGKA